VQPKAKRKFIEELGKGMRNIELNRLNYVKKIPFFLHIIRYLIKNPPFFYISGGIYALYA